MIDGKLVDAQAQPLTYRDTSDMDGGSALFRIGSASDMSDVDYFRIGKIGRVGMLCSLGGNDLKQQ